MSKILKAAAFTAALLCMLFTALAASSPAYAADTAQETTQMHGPASHDVHSPYQAALECLATHLSPEQKSESFGVLSFPDKTAKVNAIDASGTGAFSTQGGADRLMTALFTTGVRTVEVDTDYQEIVNWSHRMTEDHLAATGALYRLHDLLGKPLIDPKTGQARVTTTLPLVEGNIYIPMHLVSGAITSADLIPGKSLGFQVFGVGPNYREFSFLVGMDIKSVLMPVGTATGGTVTYARHLQKEVVAREFELGGAAIVGTTIASADLDFMKREAIQYSEGIALDRAAYDLVSNNFDNHVCDALRDYGDQLASQSQ